MLTIKNQTLGLVVLLGILICLSPGCTPPGPRALLQGQKLVEQGDYAAAVAQLEKATRLLATNAHAWNYLGLAYHHSAQPEPAAKAYQHALKLDPDLAEVRFNLGCLWLEQSRPDLAKNELTAFTLRRENVPEGFLKLATAQLATKELTAAEKSFSETLRLQPNQPEAITGIGLVRLQRGRLTEAAGFFVSALKADTNYGPALLNLAIVSQQLNNKPLALEKYRAYLAGGHTAQLDKVQATIRQLERDLAPSPPPPVQSAAPPPTPATNQLSQRPSGTNLTPQPSTPATNQLAERPSGIEIKSQSSNNPAAPARIESAPLPAKKTTNQPSIITKPAQPVPRPEPSRKTEVAVTKPPATQAPTPPPTETVVVPPEPIIRSARDFTPQRPSVTNLSTLNSKPSTTPEPPKRNLLQRINPAKLFTRDSSGKTNAPVQGPSGKELSTFTPQTSTSSGYRYTSPGKPRAGNRTEAERAFAEGVQLQKNHQNSQALQAYREAIQLDPSYFDPHYNLGLLAFQIGDLPESLAAYEMALAVRPESVDTRYNFALALRQAHYYTDAARELESVLRRYPGETRAHLALANLYAQQLRDNSKARLHYLRVLEIDPRHPQAAAIRYWLADNPG